MKKERDLPEEIERARALLDEADHSPAAEDRAANMTEALDALDDYARLNVSSPHLAYITNLRRTHARRLLVAMASAGRPDFDDYLALLLVAAVRLKPEIQEVTSSDPELQAAWGRFKRSHVEELKRLAESL